MIDYSLSEDGTEYRETSSEPVMVCFKVEELLKKKAYYEAMVAKNQELLDEVNTRLAKVEDLREDA